MDKKCLDFIYKKGEGCVEYGYSKNDWDWCSFSYFVEIKKLSVFFLMF